MKKIGLFILSILVGSSLISTVSNDTTTNTSNVVPTVQQIQNTASVLDAVSDNPVVKDSSRTVTNKKTSTNYNSSLNNLSNNNYYTNVDDNTVHAPAYAPSRPSGASAKCKDGTYSFSQNRRGTCSRHGGVATWY